MATGIISIAAWNFQLSSLALGLFIFNIAAFGVLVALTALRVFRFPDLFGADMTDHRIGPGFFTAIAASCILGTEFLLFAHNIMAAAVLLARASFMWGGSHLHRFYGLHDQA